MALNEKLMDDYLEIIDEICKWYGNIRYNFTKHYPSYGRMEMLDEVQIKFTLPTSYTFSRADSYHIDYRYDDEYYAIHIGSCLEEDLYDLIGFTRSYFTKTLQLDETKNIKQKWEELLMKNFTKKDLKNGDFVILRSGKVGIVIADTEEVVYDGGGFDRLLSWNEELTSKTHASYNPRLNSYDIMKVCRNVHTFDGAKSANGDRIVYDREKIETVEEMTLEQVCKALGKNIKIIKG